MGWDGIRCSCRLVPFPSVSFTEVSVKYNVVMEVGGARDGVEEVERGRMSAADLSWSLRSVNRAAAEVDHALAERIGLRQLDYSALGHIMDREGSPVGPAELGHRLGISTGSASELVDRLERLGHISRARDDTDRRRVSLTAQKHAVDRIFTELAPLFSTLDELAAEFSEDEQIVLNRYLRLAAQRLSGAAERISRSALAGSDHEMQERTHRVADDT